ncbi:unnamed protein product [Cunninghamella blakesleeana]
MYLQVIIFLFILNIQSIVSVSLNAIIGRECFPILNDCPDGSTCVAELENFGHCKSNDLRRINSLGVL